MFPEPSEGDVADISGAVLSSVVNENGFGRAPDDRGFPDTSSPDVISKEYDVSSKNELWEYVATVFCGFQETDHPPGFGILKKETVEGSISSLNVMMISELTGISKELSEGDWAINSGDVASNVVNENGFGMLPEMRLFPARSITLAIVKV
jgi:hypothetical protein